MPQLAAVFVLAASCLFAVTPASGLGSDHPDGQVTPPPGWPEGMAEVINGDDRVHGFWVNGTDVFFFAGDADRLNAFLADVDGIDTVDLTVTLHPGLLEARSPWDERQDSKPADWRLVFDSWGRPNPDVMRALNAGDPPPWPMKLDVYLDGDIDLDRLVVPERMAVEHGGESEAIEAFVQEHAQSEE
ncbi:MAG: hypothetical protein AAGK09_15310 [Planctomycetota bacterium]